MLIEEAAEELAIKYETEKWFAGIAHDRQNTIYLYYFKKPVLNLSEYRGFQIKVKKVTKFKPC